MSDGGAESPAVARDPQEIAEEAARVFSAEDRGTFFIGSELVEVGPGRAVVSLEIKAHHLNSAKVCHGGFVFALADSALGFASCSYGVQTLAQHADIHWLKPGLEGDRLVATAAEVSRGGRTGVYDIAVTNQHGELVASVRGMTRSTGLPVGAGIKRK
ncbi:MAG: hotdog fold thioesterase [Rhodospirillaceae bacterium]|nr:hotdog fold thioesterase [Rhodospirillaceae bacterium]